ARCGLGSTRGTATAPSLLRLRHHTVTPAAPFQLASDDDHRATARDARLKPRLGAYRSSGRAFVSLLTKAESRVHPRIRDGTIPARLWCRPTSSSPWRA